MSQPKPLRTRAIVTLASAAGATLVTVGCAKSPPPAVPLVPTPPPLHATHEPGGPITRTAAPAPPYANPIPIRVTYFAVDRMPDAAGGRSVGATARLIVDSRSDSPVRPAAGLTRDAVLIEDASRLDDTLAASPPSIAQSLGELTGLLPRGVTFATRLDDPYSGFDPASPTPDHRSVAIDVSRPAAAATAPATRPVGPSLRLALTITDFAASGPGLRQETAVLDAPLPAPGRPLALAVPFSPTDSRARAVVAIIDLGSPGRDTPPAPAVVARLDRDLRRTAPVSTRPTTQFAFSDTAFVSGTLPGLLRDDRRRAALVSMADAVDAPLTRDVALSADDATLTALSDRILGKLTDPAATFDRDNVAWTLEGTTLTFLGEQRSARTLPKALEAVLLVHTGEAGRHEGSLDEILQKAHSRADLEAALTTENQILLTDSSPSARVRAYDWLAGRGQAPEGYDPLAPPRERTAALDRWVRGRSAVPAAATLQPSTKP